MPMKLSDFIQMWRDIATERDTNIRAVADPNVDVDTPVQTIPPICGESGDLPVREDSVAERRLVDQQLRETGTRSELLGDRLDEERCQVCGLQDPCSKVSAATISEGERLLRSARRDDNPGGVVGSPAEDSPISNLLRDTVDYYKDWYFDMMIYGEHWERKDNGM